MIDSDRTLSVLGVDISTLTHGSHKEVFRVCEGCGKYTLLSYKSAIKYLYCHPCGNNTSEHRDNVSKNHADMSGENNPMFGRDRSRVNNPMFGVSLSGEKHWHWQGGITLERNALWHSQEYKDWRKSVFERDNFTCQECGHYGGDMESHHIYPYRDIKNTKALFDINNGITLCKKCHKETFGKEYKFIEHFISIVEGDNIV